MLDEDKADYPALDITVANVDDDTAVGDNSDYDDDDYQGTLESLRDDKNLTKSLIITFWEADIFLIVALNN